MNQNNIPRGQLSAILLSSLLSSDKYGLELINEIKEKTNGKIVIKQPTLYSALARLEKQGFISSYWRDSNIGGRRHYYSITDLGKKQLNKLENMILTVNNEEILQKSTESTEIISPKQKYNEIEQNQNFDEELFIKNNENIKKEQINIDQEYEKLKNLSQNSFTENLQNEEPNLNLHKCILENKNLEDSMTYIKEIKEDFNIPSEQKKFNTFDVKNFENNNLDKQYLENIDNEINYQIVEQGENEVNNSKSKNIYDFEKNIENDQITSDDAVFIKEKIDPQNFPKVKKIETTHLGEPDKKITEKISSTNEKVGYTEKINELYNKTLPPPEHKFAEEINSVPRLEQLKNYYNEMGINFYVRGDSKSIPNTIKLQNNNKISKGKITIKWFVIFMLVVLESIGIGCGFYIVNGTIDYPILYFIVPAIFALILLFLLFSKTEFIQFDKKKTSFTFSILIFILSIILIYAVNMLLGINFQNLFEYETTFIYPAILATNIVVSAVYDKVLIKKYK